MKSHRPLDFVLRRAITVPSEMGPSGEFSVQKGQCPTAASVRGIRAMLVTLRCKGILELLETSLKHLANPSVSGGFWEKNKQENNQLV